MPQAPHALEGQKTFLKQTSEVSRRTRRKNRPKDTAMVGRHENSSRKAVDFPIRRPFFCDFGGSRAKDLCARVFSS